MKKLVILVLSTLLLSSPLVFGWSDMFPQSQLNFVPIIEQTKLIKYQNNYTHGIILKNRNIELKGNVFKFPKVSVTGTSNLIMASIYVKGTTILENISIEPEVIELISFLNRCKAQIRFKGKRTIQINGVKNLKGGHYLIYKSNETPRLFKWWETSEHLASPSKSFDRQVEQYKELFFESCKMRMRSDVPLGTALSGGLDSSSVLCSMAKIRSDNVSYERLSDDWRRAFSLIYSGTSHDERMYAPGLLELKGRKILSPSDNYDAPSDAALEYHRKIVFVG